jgi:hypothetical protein
MLTFRDISAFSLMLQHMAVICPLSGIVNETCQETATLGCVRVPSKMGAVGWLVGLVCSVRVGSGLVSSAGVGSSLLGSGRVWSRLVCSGRVWSGRVGSGLAWSVGWLIWWFSLVRLGWSVGRDSETQLPEI